LERNEVARVVALDISKAFDRVWHASLLHKLSAYGMRGNVFNIISSTGFEKKDIYKFSKLGNFDSGNQTCLIELIEQKN